MYPILLRRDLLKSSSVIEPGVGMVLEGGEETGRELRFSATTDSDTTGGRLDGTTETGEINR
jgi:hypothetical protein